MERVHDLLLEFCIFANINPTLVPQKASMKGDRRVSSG
jgi:hypothetical protein